MYLLFQKKKKLFLFLLFYLQLTNSISYRCTTEWHLYNLGTGHLAKSSTHPTRHIVITITLTVFPTLHFIPL